MIEGLIKLELVRTLKFSRYLLYILFFGSILQCANTKKEKNTAAFSNKINGVSFVAPPAAIGKKEINKPKEIVNANYLSVMPYAFIPEKSTDLIFDSEWQWWGEKTEGTIKTIRFAYELGYSVMLKPHVWKKHGDFTGYHGYETEKDWITFEESFSKYIMHYAGVAEQENVAIFCVGTEWEKFVVERPQYWQKLIERVKKIYSGKLTYAANWDEYKRVGFWDKLDFIGVDAYFPLVEDKTPEINKLVIAINPYKKELKQLSDSVNSKVLFTEYGYRSRNQAALKPWEADRGGEFNAQAQSNGYQAFYDSFWNEEFIAGGFLWKWFANYNEVGGPENTGFTPQNKPAEQTILEQYSN